MDIYKEINLHIASIGPSFDTVHPGTVRVSTDVSAVDKPCAQRRGFSDLGTVHHHTRIFPTLARLDNNSATHGHTSFLASMTDVLLFCWTGSETRIIQVIECTGVRQSDMTTGTVREESYWFKFKNENFTKMRPSELFR